MEKTNYRVALDKGWEDLKRKDPAEVADVMQVTYLSDSQQFIVPFFNEKFIVDCSRQTIYNAADGSVPGISARILILHYLTFFTSRQEPVCKWVSLKEIPGGGMLFYPAFYKDSIRGLIKAFGRQSALLLDCAKQIGGQPAGFGTVSAVFQVFPKIPLCVLIWEGDEEVPANATVLFDPSIEHFLHIESVIGVGSYLANKLIKLAGMDMVPGN
nr:DUF3786 domain-containing protein [uncultured Sporomusa sp.]